MSFLRTLWRYLKRAGRAVRALVGGVLSFFSELFKTLFEGPLGGLERLVRKILELLGRLLDVLRNSWLRIWQKAPSTPRDKRRTPGREALPLLAGTATTAIWYLVPLAEELDLERWQFRGALAITWLITFVAFRAACRREPAGQISSWLIDSHRRTGLIWFERISFLTLAFGWWYTSGMAQAAPAPLMLAFGFLVLMASEYQDRSLTDDLPPFMPSPAGPSDDEPRTEEGSAETELRSFRWPVHRATMSDTLDITVPVDAERFRAMASTNPKRPMGGIYPDWSPWVVAGSTPEVARAAREIRKLTEDGGFSRFEEATAVLGFAQSVEYSLDSDSTGEEEYWRYPIETIFEQTGDCEDLSILAAAVLRELGHRVLPLVTHDHAAIGIAAPVGLPGTFIEHEGHHYYYCETTADGFRIGQLPPDVNPEHLRICPLRPPTADSAQA